MFVGPLRLAPSSFSAPLPEKIGRDGRVRAIVGVSVCDRAVGRFSSLSPGCFYQVLM